MRVVTPIKVAPVPMRVRAEQHSGELDLLAKQCKNFKSILEIGSREGGVLMTLHNVLPLETKLYSIDLGSDIEGEKPPHHMTLEAAVDAISKDGRSIELKFGDSTLDEQIEWARQRAPFDFIFIDGDHSYEGVKADFNNYRAFAQVIGFHDIRNPNLGVMQLWNEIRPLYDTCEWCQRGSIMGIGLIFRNGIN